MQRILILKVLGTKFPDCSNFRAHMASHQLTKIFVML